MGKDGWLRAWRRIVFRWRRTQLERDLAEELDFHRSLKQRRNSATSLSAEAAAGLTSNHLANEPELPAGQGLFASLIPEVVSILEVAWAPKPKTGPMKRRVRR